jgi:hypothetical protein
MAGHRDQLREVHDFLRLAAIELRRIGDLEVAQPELAMSLRHIAGQCEDEANQLNAAT